MLESSAWTKRSRTESYNSKTIDNIITSNSIPESSNSNNNDNDYDGSDVSIFFHYV